MALLKTWLLECTDSLHGLSSATLCLSAFCVPPLSIYVWESVFTCSCPYLSLCFFLSVSINFVLCTGRAPNWWRYAMAPQLCAIRMSGVIVKKCVVMHPGKYLLWSLQPNNLDCATTGLSCSYGSQHSCTALHHDT